MKTGWKNKKNEKLLKTANDICEAKLPRMKKKKKVTNMIPKDRKTWKDRGKERKKKLRYCVSN